MLDGVPVRKAFPALFAAVDETWHRNPGYSHFNVLDTVIREYRRPTGTVLPLAFTPTVHPIHGQLQSFIGHAYSEFDLRVAAADIVSDWRWTAAFRHLGSQLKLLVSFNYDTVLERALSAARIPWLDLAIHPPDPGAVSVGKPHGSADYTLPPGLVDVPLTFPPSVSFGRINGPRVRVPDSLLQRPRPHIDVVAPEQASDIRSHRWVQATFDAVAGTVPTAERVILGGLSCWKVDEVELEEILAATNPDAEIVVANPDPAAWVSFDALLRRLGRASPVYWPQAIGEPHRPPGTVRQRGSRCRIHLPRTASYFQTGVEIRHLPDGTGFEILNGDGDPIHRGSVRRSDRDRMTNTQLEARCFEDFRNSQKIS